MGSSFATFKGCDEVSIGENRITAMMGKKGGLARHLQGWEAGLVAVVIAALGTLLAVPLRVPPEDVPLPLVDGRALSATLAHDRALSAAVVPRLLQEQAKPGEVADAFRFTCARPRTACVRERRSFG